MFQNFRKKNNLNNSIIKCYWLLFASILLINMLSSCSTSKSIRTGKKNFSSSKSISNNNDLEEKLNKIKPNNSSKNNEEDYDDTDQSDISKLKDFEEKIASKNSNFTPIQSSTETTGRKIPTLREQMKQLADDQTFIKDDIKVLKNDVSEIKESLKSFKKEYIDSKPKEKPSNIVFASNTFQSDESGISDESNKNKKKEITKKNKSSKKNKKIAKKPTNLNISKSVLKPKVDDKPSKKVSEKKEPVVAKEQSTNINYFDHGMKSFQSKDFNKALELFSKNLNTETNPSKIIDTYYWIGETYFGMKKFDQAVENLNKVLKQKSHSKQSNAQILLAECFAKKGDFAEAKKAYQAFINKYPQSDYIPRAKKMIQQL